ncbi:MAG TPA: PHP domain-containing protein, partial [Bacilli bacterium]|nr:PHP domain-containing protein [Bacilli bacterium]
MDSRLIYVQTEYSFLTSMITINKLINKAKESNIKVLGIADTNMFGVLEFYKECINNDIKPVIGLEINIDNCNIVLYAKNYKGYQNLCKISTIVSENNLNIDILDKYNNDLICIVDIKYISIYSNLEKIYKEIYISYSKIEDKDDKYKNMIYLPKVRCFEEDKDYLVYLESIKEGKLIDNYKVSDIYPDSDYSNKLLNKILDSISIEITKD